MSSRAPLAKLDRLTRCCHESTHPLLNKTCAGLTEAAARAAAISSEELNSNGSSVRVVWAPITCYVGRSLPIRLGQNVFGTSPWRGWDNSSPR